MQEQQPQQYEYITVRHRLEVEKLMAKQIECRRRLDKKKIYVQNIATEDQDVQDAFAYIKQHRAELLDAYNGVERLLIHISKVSFPKLTRLNLQKSGITSVEVLPRMHMPQLKQINILSNKICTVKPLRKADFPKLTILRIDGDELREFNGLQQINFQCLKDLYVAWDSLAGSQDVSCLLKFRANTTIYNKIKQPSTRRQLQAKYSVVQIGYYDR